MARGEHIERYYAEKAADAGRQPSVDGMARALTAQSHLGRRVAHIEKFLAEKFPQAQYDHFFEPYKEPEQPKCKKRRCQGPKGCQCL